MERVGSNNQYSGKQYSKKKSVENRPLTPEEQKSYDKDIIKDSNFMKLFTVPLNHEVDDKSGKGLTYLSWAYAWAEVKKRFPKATFKIFKDPQTGWNYFTDGKTCWVEVSVTIEDVEHTEMLPIMDNMNHSVPLENVTSVTVQKSHQRALTKACARHGLGLSLDGVEDLGLPDDPEDLQYQAHAYQQIPAATIVPMQPAPMPVQQPVPAAVVQPAPIVQAQPVKAPAKPTKKGYEKASGLVLTFGTHADQTLGSVLATDRSYIEFLADPTKFEAKTADAEKFQKAAGYMLNFLAQNPAA